MGLPPVDSNCSQPSPTGWWGGVGAGDEPAACRFKLIPVQHGVVVGWVAGGIVSCRLKELDSTFRLVVGWAGLNRRITADGSLLSRITVDHSFDQNRRCR